MAFPTSRAADNSQNIADTFDAMIVAMLVALAAWRANINTNSASGGQEAQDNYQRMTSLRTFVQLKIANNPALIVAAYQARYPGLSGLNLATEWTNAKATIDTFVTWFKANWPQRTASGLPAFVQFTGTDELQSISVPIAGATKTSVLAMLDAILGAFA